MIVMQEVTPVTSDWLAVYNHTYLFDGEKAVAYIKGGTTTPIYFNKGLKINRARRKFIELKVNPFNKKIASNLITIKGSKGNVYHVDPDLKTCTCTGFQFHGKCKHLKEVGE